MGGWRRKHGWNISGWGWGKRTSYVVVLTLHRQHRFVRLLPGRFFQRFHPRGIRSVIGGIERRLGGDVRNDLAVERAFGGLEPFDEAAVGDAGGAGRGVDAELPETAEGALLDLAIAEGVGPAVIDGIRGVAVKFRALEAKAFGGFEHPAAAFAGGG